MRNILENPTLFSVFQFMKAVSTTMNARFQEFLFCLTFNNLWILNKRIYMFHTLLDKILSCKFGSTLPVILRQSLVSFRIWFLYCTWSCLKQAQYLSWHSHSLQMPSFLFLFVFSSLQVCVLKNSHFQPNYRYFSILFIIVLFLFPLPFVRLHTFCSLFLFFLNNTSFSQYSPIVISADHHTSTVVFSLTYLNFEPSNNNFGFRRIRITQCLVVVKRVSRLTS